MSAGQGQAVERVRPRRGVCDVTEPGDSVTLAAINRHGRVILALIVEPGMSYEECWHHLEWSLAMLDPAQHLRLLP